MTSDGCLSDQQDGEVENGGGSEMEREWRLKTGEEESQRDGNPGHGTERGLGENDGTKEDHAGPSRVWEAGGPANESSREEGDGVWACRICQSPKEEEVIRIGCNCKGDLALAHPSCAKQWFESRRSHVCEICGKIANVIPGIVIHGVSSRELSQDHGPTLNPGRNTMPFLRSENIKLIFFFSAFFLGIGFFMRLTIIGLINGTQNVVFSILLGIVTTQFFYLASFVPKHCCLTTCFSIQSLPNLLLLKFEIKLELNERWMDGHFPTHSRMPLTRFNSKISTHHLYLTLVTNPIHF